MLLRYERLEWNEWNSPLRDTLYIINRGVSVRQNALSRLNKGRYNLQPGSVKQHHQYDYRLHYTSRVYKRAQATSVR